MAPNPSVVYYGWEKTSEITRAQFEASLGCKSLMWDTVVFQDSLCVGLL